MAERNIFTNSAPASFGKSLLDVLGHLVGTAAIFVGLFTLAWLVSVIFSALNEIHPFPAPILDFFTKVELYFVYLDVALSALVLLVGMARFCRDVVWSRP